MNKQEFDRQFDAIFEQTVKNHLTAPDPNPSWDKIERKLKQQTKRRKWYKLMPSLAASFILGAVLFGTPAVTDAFYPLVQSIRNISTDVVSVMFGQHSTADHTIPKTVPPPDLAGNEGQVLSSGTSVEKHFKTWEEASRLVAFSPLAIQYVAADYKLSDVLLLFNAGEQKAHTAVAMYTNASSPRTYRVRLRLAATNGVYKEDYDTNVGSLEEVKINGQSAYLFLLKDGRGSLDYMQDNVLVSITGQLSKEEYMKVGENIEP